LSIRTTNPDQFAEILDAVDADAPSLAASILARFRSASADYAQLTDQELLPGIEENIHRAIAAVVGGRGPSAEERQATEELAETRARQGVGVDALLVAYRLGAEIAWERFIEHARDRGLSADEMLTGSERLRQWADELMIVITNDALVSSERWWQEPSKPRSCGAKPFCMSWISAASTWLSGHAVATRAGGSNGR
jgi:hypothetical protein